MKKEYWFLVLVMVVCFFIFTWADANRLAKLYTRLDATNKKIEAIQKEIQGIGKNLEQSITTIDFSLMMLDSTYKRIQKQHEAFETEFGRLQFSLQASKQQLEKIQKIEIPTIKDF